MKSKVLLLLLGVLLVSANTSHAAFVLRKAAATHTVATPGTTGDYKNTVSSQEVVATSRHHSFFSRLMYRILMPHHHANIPAILYVIMSIFFLGWLAMGINEEFHNWDWVLCLVLYILFWLPGFIYSLIMMTKYY